MNSNYTLVCVSDAAIEERFHSELKKILTESNCPVQRSEMRISELYYFIEVSQTEFEALNASLLNLSIIYEIDIALVPQKIFSSKKRLVVFDMDSTLITSEVIDEMALRHGVGEKVKLITSRAMNGELKFDESLTERVALLKGFHRKQMEGVLADLKLTPGTQDFIEILQRVKIKTAIASGGFKFFAEHLQKKLKIDFCFANDLEFSGDILTGKILGPIVNAEMKEKIVMDLAQQEELSLDQVVAIGDGANDIPMLLKAGLGIAIHAKVKVQKSANYRINFGPMTSALNFMNYEAL